MLRLFPALLLVVAAPARAVEIGLSGPSIYGGDVNGALAAAKAVEATGTTWARVNFRLDLWSAPGDATPRGPQMLAWFDAYDRLVDELTTHGVQVYGQIGAESVPGGGEPDSDDHVQRYAAAFVQIVDHFRDRVRVYETFNEPNNWRDAASMRPAVSPLYYAKELQEIYLNTKYYNNRSGDPCAQVTIVSGALFSSEDTDASDYWNQVVAAGRGSLAWDWMHENVGSWPYDGVGYHVYVGQSSAATTSSIASATQTNLDAIWSAVSAADDQAGGKKLWLTEFGWTIDQVSAQQQSDFLTAAFDTYAADGNVAAAFWFTYQDFPNGRYGLFDADGLAAADRRPDYDAFTAAVAKYPPTLAASFASADAPSTLAPGQTQTVTLTVHNAGGATWSEADQERLGAAPGCPSAAVANAFTFVPDGNGYANSTADARITLPAAIAPGGDSTFTFAITAPSSAGDYVFGARMVRDGVAWFGDTFRATIHVADAGGTPGDGSGGSAGGAGNPEAGSGGTPAAHHGCSVGSGVAGRATDGGATFLLGAFVGLLALFRRHQKPLVSRYLT
ncbi:MAG TPA: glycosyl hydrolase [Polyangia bacterium]|jgi:hypothetical protein